MSSNEDLASSEKTRNRRSLSRKAIDLTPEALKDCKGHHVDPDAVVNFIFSEAARHPRLFGVPFSSLPFVFGEFVLLVGWNGARALIERVLTRLEAYPLNDLWSSCLAAYRKATLLPYRSQDPQRLISSTEGRRSLAEFQRLVSELKSFSSASTERNLRTHLPNLDTLLSEAEFALINGDIATAVARLEAVLSMAHKLILQSAPNGPLGPKQPTAFHTEVVFPPSPTKARSVLLVDDSKLFLEEVGEFLTREGFHVVMTDNSSDALKALVEQDFSLVITDLVMGSGRGLQMDGREIVIAAKKGSPQTKVIVWTAYFQMSMMSDLMHSGADEVLSKATRLSVVSGRISKLIGRSKPSTVRDAKRNEEGSTAKKHIFVSYCRENADAVHRLREDLLAAGENVWWDQDVLPGQDWKLEIRRAMRDAYSVVLCVSKESAERAASGIYPEAADAITTYREYAPGSIFLIPVRLSKCSIPQIEIDSTRTLDRLQYIDLFPGSARKAGISRLLLAIRAAPYHP